MPLVRSFQMPLSTSSCGTPSSFLGSASSTSRICSAPPSGRSLRDAAGAHERVVHAQAGHHLEQPQDLLAVAEAVGHRGERAHLEAAGRERDEVRGDALELERDDADQLGARRDVVDDAEQLLDGEDVARLVGDAREVVHARHERDGLGPGAVLEVLLDAGVQVADAAAGLGDRLALQLEDEAQHAVRRRVLRTHVDDDALLLALGGREHGVPVAAGDGVDASLGGVVVARRRSPRRRRSSRRRRAPRRTRTRR